MEKALEILKNPIIIISANENHVYSKKQIDEAIVELEEAIKPKTCEGCDNNHKDRTIFYDGKKALMCTFCKYGAVSYFKPKNNA